MRQKELFAVEEVTAPIPGFSLERDYLTREEEKELIENVDSQPWESDFLRRIQQYGLGYGADLGETLTWLRDFPPWLQLLANRVSRDAFDRPAANCVINEYIPPQGIGPHRDYRAFGPVVACVSLGSDIVINFTEPERKLSV